MSSRPPTPRFAVVAVAGLLVESFGLACQCGYRLSIEAELARSSDVFVGTVVEVNDEYGPFERLSHYLASLFGNPPILDDKDVYLETMGFRVTFSVAESFKGKPEARVELYTGRANGDCGFIFEERKSYLVYATRSGRGFLATDACTRTIVSALDSEEVIELRHRSSDPAGRP